MEENIYSLNNLKKITELWPNQDKIKEPIRCGFPGAIKDPKNLNKIWLCYEESISDSNKLLYTDGVPESILDKEILLDSVVDYLEKSYLSILNKDYIDEIVLYTPEELWTLVYISMWLSQYFERLKDRVLLTNKSVLHNIQTYKDKTDVAFRYISSITTYMLNH